MRVCIVIHYFPPHIGGMEEVARSSAESLVQAGHEVAVLTCRHERGLPRRELLPPGYTVRRFRAVNAVETRFGVTFPIVSPLLFLAAYRAARRADVVHVHDAFYASSHTAALACALARTPMVMTQHVALVEHPSRLVMLVQRLMYRLAGRRLFRRAQSVIAYNENVRSFLLDQGVPEKKVLLHHNGIDTDHFTPADDATRAEIRVRYGLPLDRPVVLFVGRLVPKKGFRFVYDARGVGHYTLIVGNGYLDTGCEDDEDVRFYGPASRDELRDLYRAADLFVFPAVGEIFTLVMQEAMASGLPVVTTDDPGYADYDLDRSLISFVPRDRDAISSEIERLAGDRAVRQRMAEYSRAVAVERFSWNANFADEIAIYERLTS